MAIKSSLATSDIQASVGNYNVGRNGKKICKITIHHAVMAKASASQIANVFTNPKRKASANYCVGYTRGDICCSLYEENRAWTSSNGDNDLQAITMEVANSSTEYPYPVSDATLANIIDLCVDICRRYNFRLRWTGDKYGTLTVHRIFANTQCPGEYLMSKMQYIADEVNKKLDGYVVSQQTFTTGTYRLNEAKYIRTTPSLGNNITKVKNCSNIMKTVLTSNNPNANAKIKAGTIITALGFINDSVGRVWCKNYNGYVCFQNVDGKVNVTKTGA